MLYIYSFFALILQTSISRHETCSVPMETFTIKIKGPRLSNTSGTNSCVNCLRNQSYVSWQVMQEWFYKRLLYISSSVNDYTKLLHCRQSRFFTNYYYIIVVLGTIDTNIIQMFLHHLYINLICMCFLNEAQKLNQTGTGSLQQTNMFLIFFICIFHKTAPKVTKAPLFWFSTTNSASKIQNYYSGVYVHINAKLKRYYVIIYVRVCICIGMYVQVHTQMYAHMTSLRSVRFLVHFPNECIYDWEKI